MAKVIYGAETINNWVEEKQQLEVMLAWDLLERFNSLAMIGPLRTMAGAAVNRMAVMDKEKVEQAISEEKNKANMQYLANQLVLNPRGTPTTVLTINNQADLAKTWQRNPLPDAQYCSDIIRLFGTCIEKCGGRLAEVKEEYRDKGSAGHLPWADGKKDTDPKDSGRYRDKGDKVPFAPVPGYTDVGLLHPDVRAQKQAEFQKHVQGGKNVADPRLIPTAYGVVKEPGKQKKIGVVQIPAQKQIEDAMISKVQRFLIYQQGGQSVIAMKDTSTVARINRVFGTVPASDISGTTADTLFFFDQMKKNLPGGALDPVYYLLPAATIVAGAHHSMLEVALALSLWKNTTIDYHIGFYTSLLPARATINRGEISKSLEAAEKHKLNHHMLIFYKEPNKIDGCFLFEYGEAEAFNRLFTKVTDVEEHFRKVPAWPKEADIKRIWPARYFFGQAA